MEDPLVLELFGAELNELRSGFDKWVPQTQKMKDLRRKVRLLASSFPCKLTVTYAVPSLLAARTAATQAESTFDHRSFASRLRDQPRVTSSNRQPGET